MTVERRAAYEVRVEGRKLTGTVMRYGDISPTHKERFAPASLRLAEAIHLDLHHDVMRAVAWLPNGGLELREEDGVVVLEADLPPIPAADVALDEVRSGKADGLSIEFRAIKERREGNIRVIEEADLVGVGIVRKPSYTDSRVEARERKWPRWL